MTLFPQPRKLAESTKRWCVGDLIEYENAASDRPIEITDDARCRFLRDRDVALRYDVSRATIWRWAAEARAEREAQRIRGSDAA